MTDVNIRSADPRNYQTPGQVSLWFRKKGSTDPADWLEFGNIIGPGITAELEKLEHFSQRRGLRAKDRVITSQRSAQLKFAIDEINRHNLQFAFGSQATPTSEVVEINESKVVANPGASGTIDLGMEDLVPGSVIVRSTTVGIDEATYTNPGDFTVDVNTGIVTIAPAGALADNDETTGVPEVHIFWRKDVGGQQFTIFGGEGVEGEAKLQILTPAGEQYLLEMKNVQITNDGDITIGDGTAFQQIPLSMEILVDSDGELGYLTILDEDEL